MKDKIQKFLYKVNIKKTWPYFTAIGLLFAICCIICECLAYAVNYHEALAFLDEEFCFGISNYTVVFFTWGFLILYCVCRLIGWLFNYFYSCITNRIRKDDE